MDTGESKSKKQENLAEDIAHLYSLEHVEDMPYRTFSRERLSGAHPSPSPLKEVAQSNSNAVQPADLESERTETPSVSPVSPLATSDGSAQQVSSIPLAETLLSETESALSRLSPPKKPELQEGNRNTSTAIAIYSLAGGVGKTTITANLGRILSSLGEEIVLVDASESGLLPFYFGASDLRSGLRTFVAPGGSFRPMHVVGTEEITEAWLNTDVAHAMQLGQRTIFDCGPATMVVLPRLLQTCSILLIPLLSDLNSFLTVPRIESSIAAMRDRGLNVPLPLYVFNKVDANSLMDQEARNLAIRQIGDRLLSVSIRRSSDIPAAVADRMAVADHAPGSAVSRDFMELALQLRSMTPIREVVPHLGRWSER